jgi:hypothetical protein
MSPSRKFNSVFRRTFVTAAAATLAGCGLAPSEPSTEGYPQSSPNALFSFEWRPEKSGYEITFDRGNTLTTENTAALRVVAEDSTRQYWLRQPDYESDEGGEPLADFPLEPGATIVHECKRQNRLRIVWSSADGDSSTVVDEYWHVPTATDGGGSE